jgi:GT2 family glycosyltransferase
MSFLTRPRLRISIVIPVYKGGQAFVRCLEMVHRYGAIAHEVIVVVDGQDDRSARLAQQAGHRVIQLSENTGPAKARNIGAQAAQGEILFFLDADVALSGDTLSQIQTAFQPSAFQPTALQESVCDALIGSYDDLPGAPNFLSQYKNLLHHYTHQHARRSASTFWGACGAIRRSVFLQVGGFDERYRHPSIEDIELGYRLHSLGYSIVLDKQVQVKHLKRWGIRSLLTADFFYRAIPWTQLIWRDRHFVNDLNLDTSSRLSVVSVYGLVGLGVLSLWWTALLPLAIACGVLLLFLNAAVYRFFWEKRSLSFALRAIPWHWLYYGYSGIAFVLGTLQYWMDQEKPKSPAQRPPVIEFVTARQPDR